jgi:hypothetical protein
MSIKLSVSFKMVVPPHIFRDVITTRIDTSTNERIMSRGKGKKENMSSRFTIFPPV